MKKRRKARRRTQELSSYEKTYAKLLRGKGLTQSEVGEVIGCNQQTISALEKKDGSVLEYRMPGLSFANLVDLLKDEVIRVTLGLAVHDAEPGKFPMSREEVTEEILNRKRATDTMSAIQDQVDVVSYRDRMLSMKDFIEWLGKQTRTFHTPYEAAQAFYDECDKALR